MMCGGGCKKRTSWKGVFSSLAVVYIGKMLGEGLVLESCCILHAVVVAVEEDYT